VPFSLIACQIRHPFGALKSGGDPLPPPHLFILLFYLILKKENLHIKIIKSVTNPCPVNHTAKCPVNEKTIFGLIFSNRLPKLKYPFGILKSGGPRYLFIYLFIPTHTQLPIRLTPL
jgi:hypothetical protein